MKKEKRLSIFLISMGLILTANSFLINITGNVVSENIQVTSSILGLVFIIGGIGLFLSMKEGKLEKTLAQQTLENNSVVTDTKKLKKIARKSGYTIGKTVKEGYPIFDKKNNYITVIPYRHVSIGVSKNILRALATGESSFRKYYK